MVKITRKSGKRSKTGGQYSTRTRAGKRTANTTRSAAKRKRRSTAGRTIRKKRTTKSKSLNPAIRAHLQAYLDPFTNNHGAKIPDGSCMASMPLRHRQVFQVTCGLQGGAEGVTGPQSKNGDVHILLFPGLHGGCYYTVNTPTAEQENYVFHQVDSDFSGTLTGANGNSDEVALGVGNNVVLRMDGGIARWRLVSQALRLKLLNTDEQNDGWWESTRVQYKFNAEDWKIQVPAGSESQGADTPGGGSVLNVNNGAFFPDDTLIDRIESRNWAESPNYAVGTLKDIGRKQFNLMPYNKTNTFQQVRQYYAAENQLYTDDLADIDTGTSIKCQVGTPLMKEMYDDCMDTNHDMILIRIHPGAGASTIDGATYSTKLLAELATNHEVVYDIDSTLNKFMTPSQTDKKAVETVTEIKHQANVGSAATEV